MEKSTRVKWSVFDKKDAPYFLEVNMTCNYSNTIAVKYGINAALIAGYIRKTIEKVNIRSSNGAWVRITIKDLTGVFPFMGERAVRNAIKRLKKGNIIVSKQLSKEFFDHANHYDITDHGYAVMRGDEKNE